MFTQISKNVNDIRIFLFHFVYNMLAHGTLIHISGLELFMRDVLIIHRNNACLLRNLFIKKLEMFENKQKKNGFILKEKISSLTVKCCQKKLNHSRPQNS